MKKSKHKKERLIAWIVVIVALMVLTGLLIGVAFAVKEPVSQAINNVIPKEEAAVEEEIEQEELEDEELTEEALSEEDIEAIFDQQPEEEEEIAPEPVLEPEDPYEEEALKILEAMPIEDQVAQMFFVTPEDLTGVDTATAAGEMTKTALESYPVGGIIFFAKNIEDPEQIEEMTLNLQTYSSDRVGLPIFTGIDEEGGSVLRIAKNEKFDVEVIGDMRSIGDNGDTDEAYAAGNTIGKYLCEYGFNVDFAPDADVILEEENNVIGDRSFGTDGSLVADMVVAYEQGLWDAGVLGCPKHFPNHGATKEDSHEGTAVSERSWEQMQESDLFPFIRAIENGTGFIMVSHISTPEVTGDDTPASLSEVIITEKLREELAYDGVVITDSFKMNAVTEKYEASEAAVKAILAGADMVLMPESFKTAYEGVLAAVSDGTIPEERIHDSVRRIIKNKLRLGSS